MENIKLKKFGKINLGIVGAGNMAREHMKVYKSIKKFNLVGFVGKRKKNISIMKKKFPTLKNYRTIDNMFKYNKIDLLIICINEENIFSNIRRLLKYDCTYLFEKPLGINYLETKKILNIKMKLKKKVYVSLNRRFYDSTIKAKNLVDNFLKKKNRSLDIFINDSQSIEKFKKLKKNKKVYQNLMYCNSIHLLDYFYVFSKKVEKVSRFSINSSSGDLEKVFANIKSNNKINFIYHSNWKNEESWFVKIFSNNFSIILKPLEQITISTNKKDKIKKIFKIKTKYKPGLQNQAYELIKYFNGKRNNLVNLRDYFNTVSLIKSIYEN